MSVRISPELESFIPRATAAERAGLREKLRAEGCQERLTTWANDPENPGGETLIDGYTRHALCKELSIPFDTRALEFADIDSVKLWMLENQLGRRNLTDEQRAVVAVRVQEQRTAIAKRDRAKTAAEERWKEPSCLSDAAADKQKPKAKQKRDTRKEAAKEARVSERKMRAVSDIAKVKPEAVKEIEAGTKTIAEVKAEIKAEQKASNLPSSEQLVDAVGVPLPDRADLRAAFALRPVFDRCINTLTQTKRDMRALDGDAVYLLRLQELETHLNNARNVLRFARPHAVCPYCRGTGGSKIPCNGCKGRGWVGEQTYAQAPADLREALAGKGAA